MGAHPGLRDGDGGPGAAGAERIPGGWLSLLEMPSSPEIGLPMNTAAKEIQLSNRALCSLATYSSGEGRLYAEDLIVKIEGVACTKTVSV